MRNLTILITISLLFLPLVAVGGERMPESEQEALEWLSGSWKEDRDRTLEQVREELEKENVSAQREKKLNDINWMATNADLVMHISEDGAVHLEGKVGANEVDERGTLRVLSIKEESVNVELGGGDGFLRNNELQMVFKDEGFYFIIDGIERHYERQ